MIISGMTGERVKSAGVYRNKYGRQVTLNENAVFPPCPEKGSPTKWQKVEH